MDKSRIVQIRPPGDAYSWCENAISTVFVERMPPGYDSLAAMGVIEKDGSVGDVYMIDERVRSPGRTVVVVPGNGPNVSAWRVKVIMPGGYAQAEMDADSVIRLPCFARDTIKERFNAQVEFSGGVLKWFMNTMTMRDYPADFPELNNYATKEAIAGVKEKTQNYYRPKPPGFTLVTVADRQVDFFDAGFEPISLVIDARTPGTSRFAIVGADLLITPVNTALRPFILRSGQQVAVTKASVGPITTLNIAGGDVSTGCGVGRQWKLTNEYGTRSVWTRIGNSNVFDAVYTYPDGSRFSDKPVVTMSGRAITARIDYDYGLGNCIYSGSLSADGKTAAGTYTCTIDPAKKSRWNAEVLCQ